MGTGKHKFDYMCANCRNGFSGLCGVNDVGVPYCSAACFEAKTGIKMTIPQRGWREWLCKIVGHSWRYPGGRNWKHDDAVNAICGRCGEHETHIMQLAGYQRLGEN